MSDLSALLGDAARRAQPAALPPYDDLVRRRRRRDVRQRTVAGALVLAAGLGTAALVTALPQEDRALPPADGGGDWRDRLLSDVQLGLRLPFAPAGQAGFAFLLDEGFADAMEQRTTGAPEGLHNGPVTISAGYRGESTCLRGSAVDGIVTWEAPTREPCTGTEASVVDIELEVGPASERFRGNPLVRDGELVPPNG